MLHPLCLRRGRRCTHGSRVDGSTNYRDVFHLLFDGSRPCASSSAAVVLLDGRQYRSRTLACSFASCHPADRIFCS